MRSYRLDSELSHITVHTYAEGMLARLAHDLELRWEALRGTAQGDPERLEGSAELELPLKALTVTGILAKGQVDPGRLSERERGQIAEKMHEDVFHVASGAKPSVRVRAVLEGTHAAVRITMPGGTTLDARMPLAVANTPEGARVTGTLALSLSRLGASVIKGPMNAFRVKDSVEVHVALVFVSLAS